MKYFTMEELDYIAKELLENPNRETLKKLNDKYNGTEETTKSLNWVESSNNNEVVPTNLPETNNYTNASEPINNTTSINNYSPNPAPTIPKYDGLLGENTPIWNPIQNTNNTLFNTSTTNNGVNNKPEEKPVENLNIQSAPQGNKFLNFELPKIEEQPNTNNNSNTLPNNNLNNQVPFNGNLWEPQNIGMNNMMQTTDNFNTPIEQNNASSQIGQAPFFNPTSNMVNNAIPVSENPIPEGPTMFGQFEQNFNNNAA